MMEQIKIILPIIIILMITPAVVYGTNESSYNEGLKFGHEEFQKCDTSCLNLNALGLDCQTNQQVDNVSACNEGYSKMWLQGGQTDRQVGMCILSGHTWDAGGCQSGRLVGISSGHCGNNGTCESGGWIPVHKTAHATYRYGYTTSNESSYRTGYEHGVNDTKTNLYLYDSTSACNDINYTSSQIYSCLKGYENAQIDTSSYHVGYLQGIQGIELKGTHTPKFIKGYLKGINGYWSDRGLVEGYNGLPMSLLLQKNANYTQSYKDGHAEYLAGYTGTKKCGIDLGKLPTHTNDNYRDFYLGIDEGGDAYDLINGVHYLLYNGPPGHTVEYYAGWKFGYGLGLAFDSDCGGVAVVP